MEYKLKSGQVVLFYYAIWFVRSAMPLSSRGISLPGVLQTGCNCGLIVGGREVYCI